MKNQFVKLFCFVLLATAASSCKKAYDDNNIAPLAPSFADIPVTVTNATYLERFPVILAKGNFGAPTPPSTDPTPILPTAAQPGDFSITFSIPADKGTIKEITRVATGNAGLTALQTGLPSRQFNYNNNTTTPGTSPILGNGTNTITFTSSLLKYTEYRARVGVGTAAGDPALFAANLLAPTQLFYYFLLTLSTPQGDIQVIPTQVRVRVTQ